MVRKGQDGLLFTAFSWGLGVLVLIFVISMIFRPANNSTQPNPCEYNYIDTPIYSLNTETVTSGSFFIGIGSVNQQMVYYVFVQKQGGKILKQLDAENTIIIESNTTSVYRQYTGLKNQPFTCDGTPVYLMKEELYVPYNTIKKEYKIN